MAGTQVGEVGCLEVGKGHSCVELCFVLARFRDERQYSRRSMAFYFASP